MKPQGWKSGRAHGEFEVLEHMKLIVFYNIACSLLRKKTPSGGHNRQSVDTSVSLREVCVNSRASYSKVAVSSCDIQCSDRGQAVF